MTLEELMADLQRQIAEGQQKLQDADKELTEAEAEAQDDDAEEDLLVLEPQFDLLALLEDELLMAFPLVPMHEQCPSPPSFQAGEAELPPEDAKPHPFAALAQLKKKGH